MCGTVDVEHLVVQIIDVRMDLNFGVRGYRRDKLVSRQGRSGDTEREGTDSRQSHDVSRRGIGRNVTPGPRSRPVDRPVRHYEEPRKPGRPIATILTSPGQRE